MLPITLDLVQTVAFAGVILFAGYGIRRLIPILGKVNIPAPVCGGLPVAGILAVLYFSGIQPVKFDTEEEMIAGTETLRWNSKIGCYVIPGTRMRSRFYPGRVAYRNPSL